MEKPKRLHEGDAKATQVLFFFSYITLYKHEVLFYVCCLALHHRFKGDGEGIGQCSKNYEGSTLKQAYF